MGQAGGPGHSAPSPCRTHSALGRQTGHQLGTIKYNWGFNRGEPGAGGGSRPQTHYVAMMMGNGSPSRPSEGRPQAVLVPPVYSQRPAGGSAGTLAIIHHQGRNIWEGLQHGPKRGAGG